MRPPAAAVVGHLVWSRNGRVWAVWRVRETPYAWLPGRRKLAEHSRVRSFLAGLPAESVILSVAARIDPGEVADAMMDGVDLRAHPGWVDSMEATLDGLEAVELFRRRHYLCAQLPVASGRERWQGWWRAASAPLVAGFGLAPAPVPRRELLRAARAAEELEAKLRTIRLERATSAEIHWIYARAARRGLPGEPPLAGFAEPRLRRTWSEGEPAVVGPSLAPLLDGVFHEGGDTDDENRPRYRRYLRVATAAGVSYQAFAAVADAPQQFSFPGGVSEWLMVADQLPFPVDWACRIKSVPNYVATRGATRHQRELAGQVHEYEADPAGPPPGLASAMEAIDDERAALAANPNEPELQVAMIYATWAEDLVDLEQRVGLLGSIYRGAEFHLPVPTGGQLPLFEALLPGSATPRVAHDYRQYLLPRDLAAGMPFAGTGVGDARGMLLGTSRDAGCARPVLLDPAAGPRHDRDGSIAAFGTLGSGKSYLAKRLAATVLLRGGKMVLIDRTQAGEYVRFAAAMTEAGVATEVVTVGEDGGLLLDPLRVFSGEPAAARQAAVGYLTMICGVDPTSVEAATIAQAVKIVAQRGGRLSDVLDELRRAADGEQVALRLEAMTATRFAAPVWGDGPSMDTSADCTVIHLPNLAVPGREVLLSEHLSRRMLPEQVCSLGLLYLVAALARRIAYAERGQFAALCMDEAWALTYTLPGQQLLTDTIRDGRKHNAALWIFSQHPDDLPPALRDLVSVRFLFGLTGSAAATGLDWVGVDPTQENLDLVDLWASRRDPGQHPTGEPSECLMRDAAGRVGHVQIAPAETEALRAGFESNPTRLGQHPATQDVSDTAASDPGRSEAPASGPGARLPAGTERALQAPAGQRSDPRTPSAADTAAADADAGRDGQPGRSLVNRRAGGPSGR